MPDEEIDILFSDRIQNRMLKRLKKGQLLKPKKIALGLPLFLFLIFGSLLIFRTSDRLLIKLPADTKVYVAFNLDKNDTIFFWEKPIKQEGELQILSRYPFLPGSLNSVWQELLPQLSGQIELAVLPSGNFVFRAGLKDRKFFLANEQKIFSQAANDKTSLHWQLEKTDLLISSSSDWRREIRGQKLGPGLKKYLRSPDDLIIYIADSAGAQGFSNSEQLGFFLAEFDLPFILLGQENKGRLFLTASQLEKNKLAAARRQEENFSQAPPSSDFYFYSGSPGESFYHWLDTQAPRQAVAAQRVSFLLDAWKDFYSLDLKGVLESEEGLELSVFTKQIAGDNYWAVFFESDDLASQERILSALEPLGARLFAITHPIRVARTLSDNTTYFELRAETEGLQWQNLNLSREFDEPAEFKFLAGQGEEMGIFLGILNNGKTIITNSLEFLFDNIGFYRENKGRAGISDIYFVSERQNIFKYTRWQETENGVWRGEIVF